MVKEQIFQMKSISDAISKDIDLRFWMCGTTYPNRNYLIHRPNSTLSCIEYIISGTGEVQIDGQVFHPKAGDTYFLPEGTSQHYFSNRKDPWQKIWVNVSGDYLKALSDAVGVTGHYYFPALDTSDLLSKFQYYAARGEKTSSSEECMGLLSRLLFRLSQSLSQPERALQTAVQQMLTYIEHHRTDAIRLEQLAAVCGKSPSQAERLFVSEVGVPIYRYVLDGKIELAKQLLRETGMPVHEIAAYLSFEDAFYFSGLFRRKVGLSPTQYRKAEETEHA